MVASGFIFPLLNLNLMSILYDGWHSYLHTFFGFIYLVMLYQLTKLMKSKINVAYLGIKELLFLIVFIYIFGFFVSDIYTIGRNTYSFFIGMFVSKVALFGGIFALYLIVLNISQKGQIVESEIREKNLKVAMSEQLKSFKQQQYLYDALAKYRHNLNDDFNYFRTLLENEKYELTLKHLKKTQQTVDSVNIDEKVETGNESVNLIWFSLINQNIYEGISTDWEGHNLLFVDVDSDDFIYLFYNLLNNAFEGAVNSCDKYVHVKTYTKNNFVLIIVENSYFGDVLQADDGSFISTKRDKLFHGFGTKIIRDIVYKNGGTIDFIVEEKKFTIRIAIPKSLER